MSRPDSGRDPGRHLLAFADHVQLADGAFAEQPIPLDRAATQLRGAIEAGRPGEAAIDNDWHSGVVGMSKGRALAIAELLDELAARLSPGQVAGPIQGDGSLGTLAAELAWSLDAQRTRSEDGSD